MQQKILRAKPLNLLPVRDASIRLICGTGVGFPPSIAQSLSKVFEAVVLPTYGLAVSAVSYSSQGRL